MAKINPSTIAPIAHATSRRNLLRSAPAVAALAAIPAIAHAAPVADSAEWNAKMADLERIKAEALAFGPVFDRVAKAREATAPSYDHIDFGRIPYLPKDIMLRSTLCDKFENAESHDLFEQCREWRRLNEENDRRHGWDRVCDQDEANGLAWADAEEALLATPAPHGEALLWKLNHLLDTDGLDSTSAWSAEYLGTTMADAARLLGGEG